MSSILECSGRTRAIWLTSLASALRTTLACTVIALVSYYGPHNITRQINFHAFSYCVAIVIVSDASLGDAVRSFWNMLYATVQGVCPAIIILKLMGSGVLTRTTTAVVVAASTFVVVAPEKTPLLVKRIALGQIVIIYVTSFRQGVNYDIVMHPIHVAASTALGSLACVVALLLPFPNLAFLEIKKNCKGFSENIKERMKIFVKAFSGDDEISKSSLGFISQINHLNINANKLLQNIKSKQESMQWEIGPLKFLIPFCTNPEEKLQELDTPLKGMQIALSNPNSLIPPQGLKTHLNTLSNQLNQNLDHLINTSIPNFDFTIPNSSTTEIPIMPLETIPNNHKELPTFFFLFCLKLLNNKLIPNSSSPSDDHPLNPKEPAIGFCDPSHRFFQFTPALKSALSLGFAVLFGLIYDKDNTYWSGLIVALSMVTCREATFKITNAKAQGTVLGTIYGVFVYFICGKYFAVRFLSLVPWFIFTSFLRRSRMYGPGGGVSAVIGALLILGRKNYGPTDEFAFVRIVECFIGLSSTLVVDLVFKPHRASTLSKTQISKTLHLFHDCVKLVSLDNSYNGKLMKTLKGLRAHEMELRKMIGEAEAEPNFWFLPFNNVCYNKILGSLSKMVDMLTIMMSATEFVEQELRTTEGNIWMDIVRKLDDDVDVCKTTIGSSMKCLGEVAMIKSLTKLEEHIERNNISYDLELAKSSQRRFMSSNSEYEDEIVKKSTSFLEKSKEVLDHFGGDNNDENLVRVKSQVSLGLSAVGFIMNNLVREMRVIEKGVEELLQLENPSRNVNLNEISCKIQALYN